MGQTDRKNKTQTLHFLMHVTHERATNVDSSGAFNLICLYAGGSTESKPQAAPNWLDYNLHANRGLRGNAVQHNWEGRA